MIGTMNKALGAGLLAAVLTAPVQAIPLSDLFAGGTIQAADKRFDRWQLLNYATSEDDRQFNPANIDVTPLNDGGLDPGPGLRFGISDNELRILGNGIYAFIDLMFGFRVTALAPELFIKDASLNLTDASLVHPVPNDDDDLGTLILEMLDADGLILPDDFLLGDRGGLGSMQSEFSKLGETLTSESEAETDFSPRKSVFVTKNVLVWAVNDGEEAALTGFEQRYSQIERTVPEPGTLTLALLALGGAMTARRFSRAH